MKLADRLLDLIDRAIRIPSEQVWDCEEWLTKVLSNRGNKLTINHFVEPNFKGGDRWSASLQPWGEERVYVQGCSLRSCFKKLDSETQLAASEK